MDRYARSHLSDSALLRDLTAHLAQDRESTAVVLADLAEVDARRLYAPLGHPSMYRYCVEALRLSEDSACRRIRAARAARAFPTIFAALAEGRLHLSGVSLLAPHLTPENADELLGTATLKTKAEIEQLIAERFPGDEVPCRVEALGPPPAPTPSLQLTVPGQVAASDPARAIGEPTGESSVPGRITGEPWTKVTPLAPQRYKLQFTMDQEMHDDLSYAQELLSHQIPAGEVAKVFHRGLKLLIAKLERAKFAATAKPRGGRGRPSRDGRYIPAQVKRAVRERDQGRCTFVSESGRRCSARTMLEYDHVEPVARGGEATVENLRLRCRAHNQYEAERTFGTEFMKHKRQQARERREARQAERARAAQVAARAEAQAAAAAAEHARKQAEEVIPWLQALGIRPGDARRAAERCETIPDAPLEERIRLALRCFGPRTPSRAPVAVSWAGHGP